MMRSRFAPLIFILFFLILLVGLGLLFFRQQVADVLHEKTGIASLEVVARASLPDEQLLNTEILNSDALMSLKSNVQVFSFEDICGESINAPRKCLTGNSNPFSDK